MLKAINGNFLIKSTIFVTASSLFSNVFAYAFQLVIGRALSVGEYGIFIALLSVFSIFTLPTGIVANAITKVVTEVKDQNYPEGLSKLYYSLLKINILFTFTVIFFLIISKNFLLQYLNIDFTKVFFPFLIYVTVSLLFSHNTSFLQALKRFKAVSLLNFQTSFLKFFTGVIVLAKGLGLYATFILLSFFSLFSALTGYYLLLKNINKSVKSFSKDHLSTIYKFSLVSSFSFVGVNLMQNTDIILVKHLFSSDIAGFYSSSAVIGRIIFYGVSPIAVVFFPVCAEKYFKGEDYIRPMFKALGVVAILSLTGALIFALFPNLIVSILFGQKYIQSVQFLPAYSIYMFLYSIFAIFTWLLISVSKVKLASLALVLALLQYFTVKVYFNSSVLQIIYTYSFYVFIGLLVYILFMYKEIKKFIFLNAS